MNLQNWKMSNWINVAYTLMIGNTELDFSRDIYAHTLFLRIVLSVSYTVINPSILFYNINNLDNETLRAVFLP